MNAEERREKIVEILKSAKKPISGSELAKIFNVTRQIIVQDIAILRAAGKEILATSQGYTIMEPLNLVTKKVACRHGRSETREELMIFVESGCRVLDVIVEHPIYGEIHGMLMLNSSRDVEDFIKKMSENNASLLSELTQGVHLHTVQALNEDSIKKACEALKKKGILLS
ncbi:Transcription repressor NadR [Fervidicola ferrireducens]|uniref:Transcription repressor NadR n=1 Tax=Fervidicola ferrireducens TaxID=520764 RepID=A0A140LBR0_9FIRM|nr:transcription repressor NadR [Fervidicola ferrireducens]KXG77985.1 Transcription repressor NadR [Fervidicola ferrireducens]